MRAWRCGARRCWGWGATAAIALAAAGCDAGDDDDGIAATQPAVVEDAGGDPEPLRFDVHDARGRRVASVTLAQADTGIALEIRGEELPPGARGIHFHQHPRCDPPTFESAGPHYAPLGRQHGMENPLGPHAGDLPNLLVRDDGTADTTYTTPYVSLRPGRPNDLLRDGAVSLVIHARQDDKRTDPDGNSGEGIACGVVSREGAPR
jgi:superoxide dismutase, Cu-Zn family